MHVQNNGTAEGLGESIYKSHTRDKSFKNIYFSLKSKSTQLHSQLHQKE